MARPPAHTQLHGRIPPQRDKRNTEHGHHNAHRDVRHVLRVRLAALKLERAVVAGQQTREANEHLAQRGVHIEVELALEVVAAELAKVRLVPDDGVGLADFVKACPAREQRVDDGWDVFEVLEEELALRTVWVRCRNRDMVGMAALTIDVGGGSGCWRTRPPPIPLRV